MIEKIKNIFTNKEKRVENLISFLIILIITLIVINKILKSDDEPKEDYKNEIGVELATISNNSNFSDDNLEKTLYDLSEISNMIKEALSKVDKDKEKKRKKAMYCDMARKKNKNYYKNNKKKSTK